MFSEVATLVVAPESRGRGGGGRLLDAVDAEIARRGVRDQVVSVMAGNTDARRREERRGFLPGGDHPVPRRR